MADAYALLGILDYARPADVMVKAKEEVVRALGMDETTADDVQCSAVVDSTDGTMFKGEFPISLPPKVEIRDNTCKVNRAGGEPRPSWVILR